MKNTKKFVQITIQVFKIYWEIAPGLTLGILLTQTLMTLQSLANAYIFAYILDRLISFVSVGHVTPAELIPIVLFYATVNFIVSIAQNLNDYFNGLLSSFDQQKLRLKQTDFMRTLGMARMEDPEFTNKVTRYGEIYQNMNQHLLISIGLVAYFISATISGAIIFTFEPLLIVTFLILFVFKYINNSRFRNKIWQLSRENTEKRRDAWTSAGVLADPVHLKEILISGGALYLRKKFTNYVDWFYKEYKRIRTRWSIFEMIQATLDAILFAIGIYVVMQKGINGAITVGAITFYIRALGTFSDQIDTLSYRIGRVAESSIRIQDALELFELYEPEKDGNINLSKSSKPPKIELSNISFAYPNSNNPVIKNLSFTINPGEKIAIVGENGAGKTTLVKLITRIYKVNQGEVLIDNISLNNIKIKSWYHKLGVLFQDFNTYGHMSVGENIGIGRVIKESFRKEKIVEALNKADAISFVDKYPSKLDQRLSERFMGGIRPSGGQWQKLAIARFFYRNAPVLILDEPTASIDAVSEAKIFDNVYKFMKGKTVIIISHRFSTVRNADRIMVLDKGKIIEQGSHEQLIEMNGKYANAFNLQARGYQ